MPGVSSNMLEFKVAVSVLDLGVNQLAPFHHHSTDKEYENGPLYTAELKACRSKADGEVQSKKSQIAQRVPNENEVGSCKVFQIQFYVLINRKICQMNS